MPDITMCDNRECSIRDRCYRAQAEPSDYQSWAVFEPTEDDCEHFIERIPHTRKANKAIDW